MVAVQVGDEDDVNARALDSAGLQELVLRGCVMSRGQESQ